MHARMRDFIMTGSPRSQCSLAMTRYKQVPITLLSLRVYKQVPITLLSLRVKRSNPVNYATRVCATLLYWIATVAMLPRDDETGKCVNKKIKHHTQFPSVGGVPRSGGVVRECKKMPHPCHCEPSQMAWQSSKLCARVCDTLIEHNKK